MKKNKTFIELYNSEKEKPTAAQEFITRIARGVGKSEHTVRQWLRGAQDPDKANRDSVARVLGIDAKVLFPELENQKKIRRS